MNQRLVWLVLWCLSSASVALAAPPSEDAQACVAASTQGQTDRDEGRLLAAREQFLACAREGCPNIVKKSCAGWLTDLGERIPSVVVRVHDTDRHDVTEAQVVLDGRPIALDGRPVALDPGTHTLTIEVPGSPALGRTFLLAERELGRLLVVEQPVDERESASEASPRETPADDRAGTEALVASPPSAPPAPASFHVPTGAWVLGGLGVVEVVTFVALYTKAKNDLYKLEHSCSPTCTESQSDAGYRKLLAADVSLGIGITALAGAGAWTLGKWFVHRRDVRAPASTPLVSFTPTRGGAYGSITARY